MSGIRPSLLHLATGAALFLFAVASRAEESAPANSSEATTVISNRMIKSPIENFRKMLNMPAAERDQFLTNYPAEKRAQIAEKVREYQMLPDPLRELRLRTTELRWYLLPLLNAPATNRAERLKLIPEPYQKLVAARIEEWDLWPPDFKRNMLEYETTMDFVRTGAVGQMKVGIETLPPQERRELEQKLARWQALPPPQRQQMFAAFQHYFDLSEEERDKTLRALSEPERQETEKVLDPIGKWSKSQQEKYIAAFQQFGNMSFQERQQFLKNAERWKQMSEAERAAWRDLMKMIPPLPPDFAPPGRTSVGAGMPAPVKTNPTTGPLK
jgi:Protein of unknown function (DUF3106)